MTTSVADHFAKILFDDEAHSPRQFESDLKEITESESFDRHDFLFDLRTGLNELLTEFEQDISNTNEERTIQIQGVFEKMNVCHKLGFRDDIIMILLACTVTLVSERRKDLAEDPEKAIKRLAVNTYRMSSKNYAHVGTDALHLALINTFSMEVIKNARLGDVHLRLLHECTDRADYLALMDNAAKRNILSDGLGL